MAVFIYRSQSYRWAAVFPQSNYLILVIEPYNSYAQGSVRHGIETSEGLSACLYVHHAAFHDFRKDNFSHPLLLTLSVNIKF